MVMVRENSDFDYCVNRAIEELHIGRTRASLIRAACILIIGASKWK